MSKTPTNILFLMTDQHRWDALGCLNPVIQTPNLDALAASGVHFPQAVCNAPICVPSRYSMMTGLYPSQLGVRFNQQVCPTDADLPVPVIPQYFSERGYVTGGFGKTHWFEWVMEKMGVRQDPQRRGFQERAIATEGNPHMAEAGAVTMEQEFGGVAPALGEINDISRRFIGESETGYLGATSAYPADENRESWYTRKALDFLERQGTGNAPFLCYLSLDFPHAPQWVPPGYEERYRIEDIPDRVLARDFDALSDHHDYREGEIRKAWLERTPEERRRATLRYFALVTFVDELIGRVIAKLRDIGRWDDTLILFTSDHGEMLGDRNHRFSKFCLYEGSVRVPLILGGGALPPDKQGVIDERPAELVDLLPTLLAAAGIEPAPELPGLDLLSTVRRQGAFSEFHGTGYEKDQEAPTYSWRTQDWKLILQIPGKAADAVSRVAETRGELYDLRHDPCELANLFDAPAHRDTRESLTRNLLMHLAAVWGKYPRKPTPVLLALPLSNS